MSWEPIEPIKASETPRTDAECRELCIDGDYWVTTEFARGLERELSKQLMLRLDVIRCYFQDGNNPLSKDWFGLIEVRQFWWLPVLIVTGFPAWNDAVECISRAGAAVVPLAARNYDTKLTNREFASLCNRRVIIARDRGNAGAEAAVEWEMDLMERHIDARIWTPPEGSNNLGEALKLSGFDPWQPLQFITPQKSPPP